MWKAVFHAERFERAKGASTLLAYSCALALTVAFAIGLATAERKVYTLKPVADKGVTAGDFKGGLKPQDPDGKAPIVWVAQLVWWDVQQAVIKFDLSELPKNMQVKKATLEIYVAEFKELTAGEEPEPMKVRSVYRRMTFGTKQVQLFRCETKETIGQVANSTKAFGKFWTRRR